MQTVLKQFCHPVNFLACACSGKMIGRTGIGACSKRVICKKSWCRETCLSPLVKYFLRSKAVLLLWIICVFVSCVSHVFASVHCCLVVNRWERADLLALVGDVYCIFLTFPCGILGQVWYLIVSFTDLCILSYFNTLLLH